MTSRPSSTSDKPWLSGAAGVGMIGAGGALGRSGLSDLGNHNVLLSYGAGAEMGGGHKEPALQIRRLIEELKARNPRNFLGQLNVLMAPVESYSGHLSDATKAPLRGKKFLTGIDTGWGVFDPERKHKGMTDGPRPEWMERLQGENIRQRDPHFLRRFKNFLLMQPDGRSDTTGYLASGDARRVAGLPGYSLATYGDFDPAVSSAISGGKTQYLGRAHPLVDLQNLQAPMARDAYAKFLADHMTQNGGFEGITPEAFRGKKIITVSGATRGDTVGARARWIAEGLKAKGHNPDDYVIVGVGGRDKNLARETAIAHAGGQQKNIFIIPGTTAQTGGPSAFNSLIGNSDLHIAGAGGSSPYEALAHGGAPLAMFGDEQVFGVKSAEPWASGKLIQDRGIHGFENKLLGLINGGQPASQHLPASAPREWMNPAEFRDPAGNVKTVRRGLDGIRDYLDLRGVAPLKSDSYDGLDDLLKKLPQLAEGRASQAALTAQDIRGSQDVFKSLLESKLRGARGMAVRSGAGKLALGAGALAGGGALLSKMLNHRSELGPLPALDLRLKKSAADGSDVAVGAGLGTAALGAGIYDTGRSFAKVRPIARDYVNATRSYANKYPQAMWDIDAPRIREFLGIVDKYADASKAMSNLRLMGIPAHHITSRFPLASLMQDWKSTLANGVGLSNRVDPLKRWEIMDNSTHYGDAAKTPRSLYAREMLGHVANRQMRLSKEVAQVMGADEAGRIINAPESVSMVKRFEPYLKRMEAGEIPSSTFNILSPFFYREGRMMRGSNAADFPPANWSAKELRRFMQGNSVRGYGSLFSAASLKLSPKMKAVGALLGLAGLGTAGAGLRSKLQNN